MISHERLPRASRQWSGTTALCRFARNPGERFRSIRGWAVVGGGAKTRPAPGPPIPFMLSDAGCGPSADPVLDLAREPADGGLTHTVTRHQHLDDGVRKQLI